MGRELSRSARALQSAVPGSLIVLLCGAALAGCSNSPPHRSQADRPNVLILLIDALRADRLGVNGYPLPTTPQIDRIGAEGVNFPRAFSHSTWTKPSIATLFTSLYPGQHHIERVVVESREGLAGAVLADEFVTLAERFSDAGYATCAVVNQVNLQPKFGFAQGFEHFAALRGKGALGINGRFLQWLDKLSGRPFFAYLHYLDVHWPYTKRVEGAEALFGDATMRLEPPRQGSRAAEWAGRAGPEDLRALEVRYDREVAFADRAVGGLAEALQERGRYEDTILVITSDHGEGFLEHGRLQHGYLPYEELLRVPLVIRLPASLRAGTGDVATQAGLVDLMPTLLELAGLEPPSGAEGRSLVAAVEGGELPSRPIFAETAEAVSVRSQRYKLIRLIEGGHEFYDLAADPGETEPWEGPCQGECSALLEQLRRYLEKISQAGKAGIDEAIPLSDQELDDLRRLGYLGN